MTLSHVEFSFASAGAKPQLRNLNTAAPGRKGPQAGRHRQQVDKTPRLSGVLWKTDSSV